MSFRAPYTGVENLTVQRGDRFGRRARDVLSGLTWRVPEVRRTVLLGANGAGKTTLVETLAGLRKPTRGAVRGKETVAFVAQHAGRYRGLRVAEQVRYSAWLAGRDRPGLDAHVDAALDLTDLVGLRNRPVHHLSGGEARRLALAEGLAAPGDLLILDEPTAGLDPMQRALFHHALERVDRPTLVTTHLVEGLLSEADHVALLDAGQILFDGAPSEFVTVDGRVHSPETAFAVRVQRSRGGEWVC